MKNKFIINTTIKNIKVKKETTNEDDFYNYKYWREIQRKQLGISANLYFLFSSAVFGFEVNFLIVNKDILNLVVEVLLALSLFVILISLFSYAIFTDNRLMDFKETARFIDAGKSKNEIKNLTKARGINTWTYYNWQKFSLFAGIAISLLGFSFYLFN